MDFKINQLKLKCGICNHKIEITIPMYTDYNDNYICKSCFCKIKKKKSPKEDKEEIKLLEKAIDYKINQLSSFSLNDYAESLIKKYMIIKEKIVKESPQEETCETCWYYITESYIYCSKCSININTISYYKEYKEEKSIKRNEMIDRKFNVKYEYGSKGIVEEVVDEATLQIMIMRSDNYKIIKCEELKKDE